MARPIDADALNSAIEEWFDGVCVYDVSPSEAVNDFQSIVDEQPTLSPDEVRGVGCEVCNYDKLLPEEGLSHDFYIHDGAIYHYDSELGWEGTDIAFCPFCGKRLRMKGAEDGTTD